MQALWGVNPSHALIGTAVLQVAAFSFRRLPTDKKIWVWMSLLLRGVNPPKCFAVLGGVNPPLCTAEGG